MTVKDIAEDYNDPLKYLPDTVSRLRELKLLIKKGGEKNNKNEQAGASGIQIFFS
jgi:DNA-binding IscR family transcriptional regulator